MKTSVETRKPEGLLDYLALGLTTWGVGYLPIAPGTWGSAVGVAIFLGVDRWVVSLRSAPYLSFMASPSEPALFAMVCLGLTLFSLLSFWASDRSIPLLGNSDPSQAVVDEVVGQLITFLFIPFGVSWKFVLAGFLLFRMFDIWKPYPIDLLQDLPGGVGVCADDIVAGVYAGVCLSVIYAISLSV